MTYRSSHRNLPMNGTARTLPTRKKRLVLPGLILPSASERSNLTPWTSTTNRHFPLVGELQIRNPKPHGHLSRLLSTTTNSFPQCCKTCRIARLHFSVRKLDTRFHYPMGQRKNYPIE